MPQINVSDDNEVIDVDALPPSSASPPFQLTAEELLNPYVDIQSQFALYNRKYFYSSLANTSVEYSTRMTLCAGTCTLLPSRIRIAISEPLLKLRPRSDLLSTLLHEMIHAYLFVTKGWDREGDGHGAVFMAHARRISKVEGVIITPYHTFLDEVDHYRRHHWECNQCNMLIKRAMNRTPASYDLFWGDHFQKCGGSFVKIAEPPPKIRLQKRLPKHRAVAWKKGEGKVARGVMKTLRIDDMLQTPRVKRVKTVNCPVCEASVPEIRLNQHLDQCLAQDVFTQPLTDERGVTAERMVVAPELPLTQDSDAIVIPESDEEDTGNKLNGAEEARTRRAATQGSDLPPRPTPHDLIPTFISDAQGLIDISISGRTSDNAKNCFRPRVATEWYSDSGNENEFECILNPLLKPDGAVAIEQRARRMIKPVYVDGDEFSYRVHAERLGMGWGELTELIKVHGEGVWDMLRTGEVSCEIRKVEEGKRVEEGIETRTETRFETRIETRIEKCPLCDKEVEKGDLEKHVKQCVKDCNVESMFATEMESHDENENENDNDNGGDDDDGQRCPICEVVLKRKDLQQHVKVCMVSTGLVDAF